MKTIDKKFKFKAYYKHGSTNQYTFTADSMEDARGIALANYRYHHGSVDYLTADDVIDKIIQIEG